MLSHTVMRNARAVVEEQSNERAMSQGFMCSFVFQFLVHEKDLALEISFVHVLLCFLFSKTNTSIFHL